MVLFIYPNTQEVGETSLGFVKIYNIIKNDLGINCEKVFLDSENISFKDVKIIAFSISYELDYINVLKILHLLNIPVKKEERDILIIAGGSAITSNPEPLANFIDCFFIGEAEESVLEFFDAINANINASKSKILELISNINGLYLPDFPKIIKRRVVKEELIFSKIETNFYDAIFKNMVLIETTRGCIGACRFCTAGFIYRPPRNINIDKLMNELGSKNYGLVGPCVTDNIKFMNEISKCASSNFSLSSLRPDFVHEDVWQIIKNSKQKTITFAPEVASEKLMSFINKKINIKNFLENIEHAISIGIKNIKLYFMIGLPIEDEDDIEELIKLILNIHNKFTMASRKQGHIGYLRLSINAFIPKPATPLQWYGLCDKKTLKKRIKKIRSHIEKLSNVKLNIGSFHEAYLETLIAKGNKDLGNYLDEMSTHGAKKIIKNNENYFAKIVYSENSLEDSFAWDFIDHGYTKQFLISEYLKAQSHKLTSKCNVKTCKICGVCK
jgi:radical SAM superfamily enzyme YgiQ (UPF0313 family)